MTHRGGNGIVVGIEGTAVSQGALEWAVREASLRGTVLTVVHAWEYIPARDAGRMTAREEKTASDCMLDAAINSAVRAAGVKPEITCRSVKGAPAKVLVEHSQQAELLVIGRNHRSGVVDILRHSVSAECVRRAACPVVIIPNATVGIHAPKVDAGV
jgi:nucleotide-binding universal stress UspA family protein